MQFIVKWWQQDKWEKYFATFNTIENSFTAALWLITLMWNDFFLVAATNLKEREIFLNEPVSTQRWFAI